MNRLIRLGVAALALAPVAAEAAEYRLFTLSDGRILTTEILATEASGMRIRMPQGETEVSFLLLVDMVPIEPERYETQEDWVVWLVAPDALRPRLEAAFDAIPNVSVWGDPQAPSILTEARASEIETCGTDLFCIQRVAKDVPWFWAVAATENEGTVTLSSAVSTGPTVAAASYPSADVRALQLATYEALQLTPVGELPPLTGPLFETPGTKPPRERRPVSALAFAPVPGLPALMNKDYAGFGMALGAVVPATALWVGATGKSAQTAPEHVALGVGGFYVLTVAANQLVALRQPPALSSRRAPVTDVAVGVAPTEAGGTAITVSGALR